MMDALSATQFKPEECQLWNFSTNKCHGKGYGQVSIGRKKFYVHRLALEFALGRTIESGKVAMHSCDQPLCFNPLHLSEADQHINIQDKVYKKRQHKGDEVWSAILSADEVIEIRRQLASGIYHHVIAVRFKVARGTISQIARGHTWKSVPSPITIRKHIESERNKII